MPTFPKGYTKAMLLLAVDAINEVADSNLKVKSKTAAGMVDLVAEAVRGADHVAIAEDLSQDHMETLIAFNIIEDFIDEDTYSKKLIAALKSVDGDTAQASEPVAYTEDEVTPPEDVEEEVEEEKPTKKDKKKKEDKVEEALTDNTELLGELEALEEELEGTTKKKKRKKLEAAIDEVKAKIDAEQAAPEEVEEEVDTTLLDAARDNIAKLTEELGVDGLKKKKKKKILEKLDKAKEVLQEIKASMPAVADDEEKPAKVKSTRSKGGVIATIGIILLGTKKFMTAEDITAELSKRLPEGNPETMIKTVKAQLYCRQAPCRLEKEKGVKIEIKGEGTSRSFKATE